MVAKMRMKRESSTYCLRAPLSLAFKTALGDDYGDFQNTYGAGFNAQLEVGWTWTESLDKAALTLEFSNFVKKIDHRHLGMDTPQLQITTPESLIQFAVSYFAKQNWAVENVRLSRGEDIVYRYER